MRSSKTRLGLLLCGVLLALPIGCGSESGGDDGHLADAGHDGHDDHEDDVVPCGELYPAFRPGMSAKAGDLTVRLLSIDPEPPRQKMDNRWVLEVVGADGQPLAGAQLLDPDTWMDVHKHGGRWNPTVSALPEPGRFEMSRIDFKMPGPWSVRFDVKASASAPAVRGALQICVE